jgi:NADPH:quinone reductase-like Zn-dependent oxidoreductase
MASYRAVMLTKKGGPEVLETVELPVREPAAGEARVRVLACGAGTTDVMMRRSYYPYAPKIPFVPGYEIVGEVEAVGADVTTVKPGDKVCALTIHGGYAELLYRGADDLVAVPAGLDDAEVVALILNYVTAYQMIHRTARQQAGESALVTGANGGVGQAMLELLHVAGVAAYGAASKRSHDLVRALGGIPIDGREAPVDVGLLAVHPEGVDASYDSLGGKFISQCRRATRRGGWVIGYGVTSTFDSYLGIAGTYFELFVRAKLMGRRSTFYGITQLYRKTKTPFREDLAALFGLLAARKIQPKIAARLPLLDGRKANELLEAGGVDGKLVLVR